MTVINTNVGALQARTYAVRADSSVTKAMERLSSGLRINSAADDAAGLAVANKMESQIRGMNMAIRNSQDGISLVQTAEAAMGEINNMVIRMRELAVQMNNGVYTDADRANAQLEVTALLAEIDKVADNSAFNQVKILDGTYSQDIRAGNTNPEVINVTIDRMNTDSLGGGRVTTGDVDATTTSTTFKTSNTTIEATEGRVTFGTSNMGTAIKAHADSNAGGTWSIVSNLNDSSSLFEIDAASGAVTLNSTTPVPELNFDTATPANNEYTFAIQYTQGGVTVTDNITLNLTDKPVLTSNTTLTSSMQVEEGNCIKIYSVDTTDLGSAQTGIFSDAFQEFVAANGGPSGVTFAMAGGADDGEFTLNTANGSLQANLDFERPDDANTDNVYSISVSAAAGGVTITENITLTILDDDNPQETANEDSAITGVEAAAAVAPVIAADLALTADIDTTAAGVTLDMTTALDAAYAGGTPFADFVAANAGGAYTITNGDGTAVAAGISAPAGTLTLANTLGAGTYDNLKLTYTATDGNTFNMFLDLTVTASAGAADTLAANGAATQAGEARTLAIQAGGEAFTLDLKLDSDDSTPTDAIFNGIGEFYQDDPCGTWSLNAATLKYNGATGGNASNLSMSADGVLTLAAGAVAGVYEAEVTYENNDGEKYVELMTITSTDIGEAPGNDFAVATALSSSAATRQSTEQIAGTTVLALDEARQGNITSTGTGAVLSAAFNTFTTSYTGGTYSVSGTDAELFNINASTGQLETKGLVDFETKNSYSMTVTYTSGNNSYSEDITVNVTNNPVDDGSHIVDVNLGSQAGSATAVNILDTAINQISESQAKLGAIQNRLQYNIDNLSKASMLTAMSKGRIMDADFASETSELSKQQILSQAATSMLAQANQSKQSVLALLQ
jgi:flagellin